MLRVLLMLAALAAAAGSAAATPYKPPRDIASALATFRAGANRPGTPAEQPAIEAAKIVFARVPLVGMPAGEARALLGEPSTIVVLDGDARWRYLRHNGEGVGALTVVRIHDGHVATVVSFPTE
jgi:hypothetical protein